ncbi:MAG: AsnC family transcriptional regulator [Candidatus Micrarchaeota archaeon]|nr:AsnC family transcriptional regulator [Candidatus Micrarchaeota archaeon]MDE1834777.1 AsnC family transcriptional regulator [Candidatus Micrarchaeota archaeon]MDE1859927.1 AsnC family transcriptional regulator [Candidatus Micrarchaeota archaeon]
MITLPERIQAALEKIKKSNKHYVDIKVINGRCYVYESTSVWDKQSKSVKKITKYIGRITDNGTFVRVSPRKPELSAAVLKKSLSEEIPVTDVAAQQAAFQGHDVRSGIGKYDIAILSALSADGRVTLSELGKAVGLSVSGTDWQRKNVESKYGVQYIAEINVSTLGFLSYVIEVKFENKIPSAEEIKDAFSVEPMVQLVMFTRGDFDLLLFVFVGSGGYISGKIYDLMRRAISNYDAEWYVVPAYVAQNFVPLRDQFFEILKEMVWHKTKEAPRPKENQLLEREFVVLRELNMNGTMDFADIDKKYGFEKGRAQYTYHKLVSKGILKRITINMANLPINYTGVIFVRIINAKDWESHRREILRFVIEEPDTPMNKYSMISDIGTPYGVMFVLPVFDEGDLEIGERGLVSVAGNIKIRSLVVTNIAVGSFCNRKLDKKLTNQYKILIDQYRLNPEKDF